MKRLLRIIYSDNPRWWHFWNLYNPIGAVIVFFLSMGLSTWLRNGRGMFIMYASVFIPGAIAYFWLKPYKTNP